MLPPGVLQCVLPAWPLSAQNVSFSMSSVVGGEVVVPFTGIDTSAQSFFSFIPAWYTVNSNKAKRGAASGGTQFCRIAGINWFRH